MKTWKWVVLILVILLLIPSTRKEILCLMTGWSLTHNCPESVVAQPHPCERLAEVPLPPRPASRPKVPHVATKLPAITADDYRKYYSKPCADWVVMFYNDKSVDVDAYFPPTKSEPTVLFTLRPKESRKMVFRVEKVRLVFNGTKYHYEEDFSFSKDIRDKHLN